MASLLGYQIRDEQSMGFVRVLGQPADLSAGGSGLPVGLESPGERRKAGTPVQPLEAILVSFVTDTDALKKKVNIGRTDNRDP